MDQDPPEVTVCGAVVCAGCCWGGASCVGWLAGAEVAESAPAEPGLAEPVLAGAVGVALVRGVVVPVLA